MKDEAKLKQEAENILNQTFGKNHPLYPELVDVLIITVKSRASRDYWGVSELEEINSENVKSIELANEQIQILEKENAELKQTCIDFTKEVAKLVQENERLKRQMSIKFLKRG